PDPATRSPGGRAAAFARLSAEIRRCTRCSLAASRTQAVVYRGSLAPRLVFVGEAPGAEEDRTGVPFVGRSGRRLDDAIARLRPGLGTYGVLNVLKCRPPKNRFDPEAARTCRPFLERQLALLRPRRLVTLGARALRSIDPEAPPVLQCAGRPRAGPLGPFFPLVHPAALRSARLQQRWDEDLRALGRWLARPPLETL
ncbi:MAG TPA: uracil-DNA glycosylase, partial [Thermoplasmata archaeon]|nr:uracil-DNA glycosylase [Thermoplasmata archaeon]